MGILIALPLFSNKIINFKVILTTNQLQDQINSHNRHNNPSSLVLPTLHLKRNLKMYHSKLVIHTTHRNQPHNKIMQNPPHHRHLNPHMAYHSSLKLPLRQTIITLPSRKPNHDHRAVIFIPVFLQRVHQDRSRLSQGTVTVQLKFRLLRYNSNHNRHQGQEGTIITPHQYRSQRRPHKPIPSHNSHTAGRRNRLCRRLRRLRQRKLTARLRSHLR